MSPDTRFGAYEVQALIGRGGMSEVYRARDVRLNREVAVKVLGRPFASDPAWLTRNDREAQLLAALNHPHVAQIRFLAIVRTEDAPPPRVRVVLGWDHEVIRLGRENAAKQ